MPPGRSNRKKLNNTTMIRAALCVWLLSGCASLPDQQVRARLDDVQTVLKTSPSFIEFLKTGPFRFRLVKDFKVSTGQADLFITKSSSPTHLVIIQHGNAADKRVHRVHAEHLASWGFNVMTLEQPNRKQWVHNGHRIAKLIHELQRDPARAPAPFRNDGIILVGHSFGASAMAIAAGKTNVAGVIFLDPALYKTSIMKHLKRIKEPVMLLGADRMVFQSKRRKAFYELVRGNVAQVSVKGATHNDAQLPSITTAKYFVDFTTSKARQHHFMAAITATVFSLSKTTRLDYAWECFRAHQHRNKNSFFGFRRRMSRSFRFNPESRGSF